MPSPPKPWERAGVPLATAPLPAVANRSSSGPAPAAPSIAPASSSTPTAAAAAAATAATDIAVPPRPAFGGSSSSSGFMGDYDRDRYDRYSRYGSGGYGSSYGSSYGSYGSRLGGYGGYGGYGGGYGGTYGGYGGAYGGGYGGYGRPYGLLGPHAGPGNFVQSMEQSSATAFQLLDSIVQAFGGFAQMLESTVHATHSSFFAMVAVVDQFSILREYFGQILGAISLYRFVHDLYYRIRGKTPPALSAVDSGALSVASFEQFSRGGAAASKSASSAVASGATAGTGAGSGGMSRTPLLLFLAALVGIPYTLSLLFRFAKQHPPRSPALPAPKETATAQYDFEGQNAMEISFRRGDKIAVLSRTDSKGTPSAWWKGYVLTEEAPRVGMFPGNHVQVDRADLAPEA